MITEMDMTMLEILKKAKKECSGIGCNECICGNEKIECLFDPNRNDSGPFDWDLDELERRLKHGSEQR